MTPEEHKTKATYWANIAAHGDPKDRPMAWMRTMMHLAAATGTFLGDARTGAVELDPRES